MINIEITDQEWQEVEVFFERRFGKTPDLQAMLYLIGINEYGHLPKRKKFTKEQKQDLMHVAVCSILVPLDYYMLEGYDSDGWPHFIPVRPMDHSDLQEQEELLIKAIILYVNNINNEIS